MVELFSEGERYDFVLNARMKTGKYFIKAINSDNQFQLAELIYEGAVGELDVNSVNFTSANRSGKVSSFGLFLLFDPMADLK